MTIEEKYREKCTQPSDIHEHLPVLRRYTEQCCHITELGVRTVVSTWAFLAGLAEPRPGTEPRPGIGSTESRPTEPRSGTMRPTLISVDIAAPAKHGGNLNEVITAAEAASIQFHFIESDDLKIELAPTDLLFIDTWHEYKQLKAELALHAGKARKFIILHDTETYGTHGERLDPSVPPPPGLRPALIEFLLDHPEWRVKEHLTNCNGLTVLENQTTRHGQRQRALCIP